MNLNWQKPTDHALADLADQVAALVEHANGKGGTSGYRLNLKYVEIGNEPGINSLNVDNFIKLLKAVGQRIHRDYPGVKIVRWAVTKYRTPSSSSTAAACSMPIGSAAIPTAGRAKPVWPRKTMSTNTPNAKVSTSWNSSSPSGISGSRASPSTTT